MNKIIFAAFLIAAVLLLLKRKEGGSSFADSKAPDQNPEPVRPPDTSSTEQPAQGPQPGPGTGKGPSGARANNIVQIEHVQEDELRLKTLIDWFYGKKDELKNKPGSYRGIVVRDSGKSEYKRFFSAGKADKTLHYRVLAGFFNDKDRIDEGLPLVIFNTKAIASDLESQFAGSDLILLT